MPVRFSLLALSLCASVSWGAEIRPLKGQALKGDVVALSDKEIVVVAEGERKTLPIEQVLQIDFAEPGRLPADARYSDVELTDGTLLHCDAVLLKGKQAELTLLGGQVVTVPLTAVANYLREAHNETYRRDWTERVGKKRRRDVLARQRDGVVNGIEGTLGEGDAGGKSIVFTAKLGTRSITRTFALADLHGLIFERPVDPNAAPVRCKLTDTHHNLVLVASATSTPTGLTVTTPAGAKIEYRTEALVRLDYSKGKLTYLSDLEPVKVVESSTEDVVYNYMRDKNLDGGPLRLGPLVFARGLALHAYTELEYDLKGEYREFQAKVGIDTSVGGIEGPVILRIEGDGNVLCEMTFDRKDLRKIDARTSGEKEKEADKGYETITRNVKDVQRLRIVVRSGDLLDLGKHLDLADAKVSK